MKSRMILACVMLTVWIGCAKKAAAPQIAGWVENTSEKQILGFKYPQGWVMVQDGSGRYTAYSSQEVVERFYDYTVKGSRRREAHRVPGKNGHPEDAGRADQPAEERPFRIRLRHQRSHRQSRAGSARHPGSLQRIRGRQEQARGTRTGGREGFHALHRQVRGIQQVFPRLSDGVRLRSGHFPLPRIRQGHEARGPGQAVRHVQVVRERGSQTFHAGRFQPEFPSGQGPGRVVGGVQGIPGGLHPPHRRHARAETGSSRKSSSRTPSCTRNIAR